MSRASVANIERGAQRVPVHMIEVLADALGVTPESLLPPRPTQEAPGIAPAMPKGSPSEGIDALRLVLRKAGRVSGDGQA